MLGIDLGMVAVMVVAAAGLTATLMAVPGAGPVLVALAAIYFLQLAWRIATALPLTETSTQTRPPSPLAGFLLSLVNPKGYAAMAALFSGFTLEGSHAAGDALAKIGLLTAVIAAVNVAWLLLGTALTRAFRHPRLNRVVNSVFAVLLLASLLPLVL